MKYQKYSLFLIALFLAFVVIFALKIFNKKESRVIDYKNTNVKNFKVSTARLSSDLFSLLEEFNFILLVFYPQDKTPGCSIQIKRYDVLKDEFKNLNTLVLGISMDSAISHKEFCESKNMTIDLISDEDGSISESYGVLKRDGMFRFTQISRNTVLIGREKDKKIRILNYSRNVSVFNDANNQLSLIRDLKNNH